MTVATITEDYVTFETAKLLKEKGFDVPCNCYGAYNGVHSIYRLCITDKYTNWNKHTDERIISCPTLQMAMKWLREVHCIWISVFYGLGNTKKDKRLVKWEWEVYNIIDDSLLGQTKFKEECYDTYEEAAKNGIKYCLENLI